MTTSTDTKQALQLALKQNTPRIERAIQELARSFVTVDICGSDANEVATYVHQLEAALQSALQQQETREPVAQGCELCLNPLFAGTKCKNCGRIVSPIPQQDADALDGRLLLTEEEREHLHQAIDKLGDYEHLRPELRLETNRTRGVLQKLFRFLPSRAAMRAGQEGEARDAEGVDLPYGGQKP